MDIPFHPIMVHFPIALAVLMPVIILTVALMIKNQKFTPITWLLVVGLQLTLTVTGYISLESGEGEEDRVAKVVEKKHIHHHEEKAEVFVGTTVLALVVSVASYFLKSEIQFFLQLGVFGISLISTYFGYVTGHSGGEIIYEFGGANAYASQSIQQGPSGLLPTPGMNTSESPMPQNDNESLKPDENDYGDSDDSSIEGDDDEEVKQED